MTEMPGNPHPVDAAPAGTTPAGTRTTPRTDDAATGSATPGSFTFIGNATALIQWGPFTLLTDPNFLHAGQRAYLGHGLTSKRRKDPALQVSQLPPLDAVVLSHMHGDHWDRVAKARLDHSLPVLTTPKAARTLQARHRFRRATGLATWEAHTLYRDGCTVRVTALPGRHAPGVTQRLLPPVMGTLLEFAHAGGEVEQRLYLTGDTLMYDGIREIHNRFPDIDVTVIHLGGTTLPGGLMVTMDGEQGVELVETVLPRRVIPVHFDDYDVFKSPLSDFLERAERRGMADRVALVGRGETVTFGG